MSIQDLDSRFPISNPDGTPTEYFLRLIRDRGSSQKTTDSTVEELAASIDSKAEKATVLTAGVGLDGGGDLSADRTFDLNASLDDLNDVDTSTTPPTDQQALLYDDASGLWIPGDVAAGGGGSSEWEVIDDTTLVAASAGHAVDVSAYDDIICVHLGVTTVSSSVRGIVVSTDNGATYPITSGDYVNITSAGVATNTIQVSSHSTGTTAARAGVIRGYGLRQGVAPKTFSSGATVDNINIYFKQSNDPITHIKYITSTGNMTAGRFITYGRKGSGGGGVGSGGVAFPASPTVGQRYFRTDRGIEYYWDGTRWLSTQIFTSDKYLVEGNSATLAATGRTPVPFKGVYDIYMLDIQTTTYLTQTPATWTISLLRATATNVTTTIASTTAVTPTTPINNWGVATTAINAVLDASAVQLNWVVTENSGTASIYAGGMFTYRLVG
jgi:hypothetical protein